MKTLSASEFIEIRGISTHSLTGICLGDFDNDGDNELAVCGWSSGRLPKTGEADVEHSLGVLYVLKYSKLYRIADEMSVASCVTFGDVCNVGHNFIIVTCCDCDLYLYHVDCIESSPLKMSLFVRMEQSNGESTPIKPGSCYKIRPVVRNLLPPNSYSALVADVDGDGLNEFLVSSTDRYVRLFRWKHASEDNSSTSLYTDMRDAPPIEGGFETLMEWELGSQIGSITLHRPVCDGPHRIFASQSGGTYAELHYSVFDFDENKDRVPYVTYESFSNSIIRHRNIKTEMIGNLQHRSIIKESSSQNDDTPINTPGSSPYMIVCTHDGSIAVLDPGNTLLQSGENIPKGKLSSSNCRLMWEIQVHRPLFGISKIPLTDIAKGNEGEAAVMCTWEGLTYIVDDSRQVFRFYPGFPCGLFTAGLYALDPGENVTAFIFVFTAELNYLGIYFNLSENLAKRPQSLIHQLPTELKDQLEKRHEMEGDLPSRIKDLLYLQPVKSDQTLLPDT